MCAQTLNGGPLVCIRLDDHEPEHGCCYETSDGSSVADRHDATNGGEH